MWSRSEGDALPVLIEAKSFLRVSIDFFIFSSADLDYFIHSYPLLRLCQQAFQGSLSLCCRVSSRQKRRLDDLLSMFIKRSEVVSTACSEAGGVVPSIFTVFSRRTLRQTASVSALRSPSIPRPLSAALPWRPFLSLPIPFLASRFVTIIYAVVRPGACSVC